MEERKFTMFINDMGYSMHFVLLVPDKELCLKTEKLIREHFGAVSTDQKDISEYSIVLEEDDTPISKYPEHVFKLTYIKDCIDEGSVLDVSKYLKGTSPKFVSDFDYMMIVYFREYTWDEVPEIYLIKNKIEENRGTSGNESMCSRSPVESDRPSCTSQEPSINNSMKNKQHDNINPTQSELGIAGSRTRSMRLSMTSTDSTSSESESENVITSMQSVKSKQKLLVNNRQQDSCSSSSSSESGDDSIASIQLSKEPKFNKKTKSSYTRYEKESILRYIIENKEYHRLKGNALWREMEDARICEIRTWQSMKEHFRKVMSKQLNMFSFLTENQIKKLK